jgi:hypothetical protein
MAKPDELLEQGPRQAPEPETAEQRSNRPGRGAVAGGAVAAGAVLAKVGVLGKLLFFLFAWHGAVDVWRLGGWIGLAALLAVLAAYLVLRARKES